MRYLCHVAFFLHDMYMTCSVFERVPATCPTQVGAKPVAVADQIKAEQCSAVQCSAVDPLGPCSPVSQSYHYHYHGVLCAV